MKRQVMVAAAALAIASGSAGAQVVNGGFEAGNFTGWTKSNGGNGDWVIDNNANSGTFAAMSTQGGPGQHEISQSFTLSGAASSAILKFSLQFSSSIGTTNLGDLSYGGNPNEHGTVDIFSGAYSPFSVGGSSANYFLGAQAENGGTSGWVNYTFDVTSFLNAAGIYTLRFAEADNQGNFYMNVDDVSLDVATTPEPASLVLMATGLFGVVGVARRRRNKA